jgi:WD40 repeat protein
VLVAVLAAVSFVYAPSESSPNPRAVVNRDVPVTAAAFSPNGKTIATADSKGVVSLWEAATGQPQGTIDAHHAGVVRCLAFSPDSATLASAGWDHEVKLWDVESGRIRVSGRYQDSVRLIRFQDNGVTLEFVDGRGVLMQWDRATDKVWTIASCVRGPFRCVAFSADGSFVAFGDEEGALILYEKAAHQVRRLTGVHVGAINAVAFSADGSMLATGGVDRRVQLWDVKSGRPQKSLDRSAVAKSLAFSPDGRLLAAGYQNGSIRIWDVAAGIERGRVAGHSLQIWSLAFSPDGQKLASASHDGCAKLWDLDQLLTVDEP